MKNRIKEIIENKGHTMYSFGKEKGITPQRIWNWTQLEKEPKDNLDLTIKHYLGVDKYIY